MEPVILQEKSLILQEVYPEMSQTTEKLKEIMVERLKLMIDISQIHEDTFLFGAEGLNLDSIDILELIIAIKKEFGVEIMDKEVAQKVFTTVNAVAEYIDKNRP